MANGLDNQRLGLVFQSRPDILAGIQQAADSPARITLFNNIAKFVYEQINTGEPASKRRRVDEGATNGHAAGTPGSSAATNPAGSIGDAASEQVLLEIKDISLSIPQRKKFDLCFTKGYLYARAPGTTAPVQGIVYAWRDIEYAFFLPVPEKTQLQYNYVLFPRNTALASISKTGPPPEIEPLVFTVPATAPKPGTVSGPLAATAASVSDTYSSLLHWALTTQMRSAGNKTTSIVASDPKVFHSLVRQAHRPGDKATHVKAFRGSKDGYLFFLPTGILWAFKKPLLFIPLERVTAVSYTSVLQRTFNMVVEVDAGGEKSEEIEFGMLDQEDYGGIDETYVRRHGLLDGSMATRRKAKTELAENLKKNKGGADAADGSAGDAAAAGAAGAADGEADDGLTELQRAEMMLQDEEDEMEEDYDPGSGGDSDSEGASSDEDEDEDGEEGEDDDEDDEVEEEDGDEEGEEDE